jgi:hypothetical protein
MGAALGVDEAYPPNARVQLRTNTNQRRAERGFQGSSDSAIVRKLRCAHGLGLGSGASETAPTPV